MDLRTFASLGALKLTERTRSNIYQIPNTEHMAHRLRHPEYGVGLRELHLGQQGVIYPQGGRGVEQILYLTEVQYDQAATKLY